MKRILLLVVFTVLLLVGGVSAITANATSMMHFNYTPGYVNFTDDNGVLWSRIGTAPLPYINTTLVKSGFGSGSVELTGTSKLTTTRLSLDEGNWSQTNHTVEYWIYPKGAGEATQTIVSSGVTGSYPFQMVSFYDGANKKLVLYSTANGIAWNVLNAYSATPNNMIPFNTWSHVEIDLAYPTLTVYVNGLKNSTTTLPAVPIVSSVNISIGADTSGANTFTGNIDEYVDWNITRHFGNFTPPTSEYSYSSGAVTSLVSSFSANTTGGMTPIDAAFTDTSLGTPTTFNWTFREVTGNNTQIIFSTLQNPIKTFGTVGNYFISLNVTNSTGAFDISTQNTWINVTPYTATGFNRQDLVMYPRFSLTVNIIDSSTHMPIPVVVVIDSVGNNQTTTTGVFTASYPYSSVVLYLTSSGYDSKSVSYVVGFNRVETVTMTKSAVAPTQNTIYQAQLYRFMLQNLIGTPLGGLSLTITPLNLTMDSTWTTTLLGVSPNVDIMNGVIFGTTGSDGSFGAPMITPLGYRINITGTAHSGDIVDYSIILYPPSQGTDIVLSLPTSVTGFIRITPTPAFITYNLYNQSINSTAQILSVNFHDPTGSTNITIVTVRNQTGSILNMTTYLGSSASNIIDNFTYVEGLTSPSGDLLKYGVSAYVPTAGGWNNITETFDTNRGSSITGSAIYDQWAAIIIIVLVASAFTASTVYIGTMSVGLMGLFFCYVVKWLVPKDPTIFTAVCLFWICIGVIGFIMKKSRGGF